MKQKKVIEVQDEDLVVGEVYCDTKFPQNPRSAFLRFVKYDKHGSPRFEFVSGMGGYLIDHEGYIGFGKGELYYKEIETDTE